jgi:hypothetical protein
MPNIKAIRQKIQKNFFIKLTSVSKPWGGVPLGGARGRGQTSDLLGTFVSVGGTEKLHGWKTH